MSRDESPTVAAIARVAEVVTEDPQARASFEVTEDQLDDFIREWVKRAKEVRVTPAAKRAILKSIHEHGDESPWLAVGLIGAGAGIGLAVGYLAKADPAMMLASALAGAAMALLGLMLWQDRRVEIDFDPVTHKFRFVTCPMSA